MKAGQRLAALKALHTAIWQFFATGVIAIPIEAWQRRFDWAVTFIVIVGVEVADARAEFVALSASGHRSPLHQRPQRQFRHYRPAWLASRTMVIFGPLLAVGICLTAAWWASGG